MNNHLPNALPTITQLDTRSLRRGLAYLATADPDLARVLSTLGPPPLWARRPGFPTLIHIILEQQVSLASARAAMDRLRTAISPVTPGRFLTLDDATLHAIGFSRQKTAYGRCLAQAILAGELDLAALPGLEDDVVRAELCKLKGIGTWTADVYLLMALRRPDTWPCGDLALAVALQQVKRLPTRPSPAELQALSQPWRPWRAVAARLLWHWYLHGPNAKRGAQSAKRKTQ